MLILFVSAGPSFQEYLLDNIQNLMDFGNAAADIHVITERAHFPRLAEFAALGVRCVDTADLSDFGYNKYSRMDRHWRDGFWHYASLRLFYVYSYLEKTGFTDCFHIENDVMSYCRYADILSRFKNDTLYVTFDSPTRVIPGMIYIPRAATFRPVIEQYNPALNDMQNLARFGLVSTILPIWPSGVGSDTQFNENFGDFGAVFDTAAIGQYLGGIDPRNQDGDTRGFINETCVYDYSKCLFFWRRGGGGSGVYAPWMFCNYEMIPILTLHIHSKQLADFMGRAPRETKFIKIEE